MSSLKFYKNEQTRSLFFLEPQNLGHKYSTLNPVGMRPELQTRESIKPGALNEQVIVSFGVLPFFIPQTHHIMSSVFGIAELQKFP